MAPDCASHLSCSFSNDGKTLHGAAGAAWDKTFDVNGWRVVRAANRGKGAAYTQLSDDGQVGVRSTETRLEAFDAKTGASLGVLATASAETTRLSPDGQWLTHFDSNGLGVFETKGMRRVLIVDGRKGK